MIAKEKPSTVWDKLNRRLHHLTKLRTNSSRFEAEHCTVSAHRCTKFHGNYLILFGDIKFK